MFKILSHRRYAELLEAEVAIHDVKETLIREGISNDPELVRSSSSRKLADAVSWVLSERRNSITRPIGYKVPDSKDAEITRLKRRIATQSKLVRTLINYKNMLLTMIPSTKVEELKAERDHGRAEAKS